MAEHLSDETLARMVEGPAGPDERRHVESCPACAAELHALREQTRALGALPRIRPPRGQWEALEARLRSEGLIAGDPGSGRPGAPGRTAARARPSPPVGAPPPPVRRTSASPSAPDRSTPGWLRIAAALALFLGGGVAGAAVSEAAPGSFAGRATPGSTVEARFASSATAEEAAADVREAERRYVEALLRYRELSGTGTTETGSDPTARYAALDAILSASRAAVREAPADPFLNGVLVSTLAERQATLQRISTEGGGGDWY